MAVECLLMRANDASLRFILGAILAASLLPTPPPYRPAPRCFLHCPLPPAHCPSAAHTRQERDQARARLPQVQLQEQGRHAAAGHGHVPAVHDAGAGCGGCAERAGGGRRPGASVAVAECAEESAEPGAKAGSPPSLTSHPHPLPSPGSHPNPFQECEDCPNVRYEREPERLTVHVEPGMPNGHVISFFEEGEPILDGACPACMLLACALPACPTRLWMVGDCGGCRRRGVLVMVVVCCACVCV